MFVSFTKEYLHKEYENGRISGKYFPLFISGEIIQPSEGLSWSRDVIVDRDLRECQILSCGSKRSLQPHHVVSECLINKVNSQIVIDTYTGVQLYVFSQIQNSIKKQKNNEFKRIFKKRIIHTNNAITLCSECHFRLHSGILEDKHLISPTHKILRPKTFEDGNVLVFMKIMVEETLRDIGVSINSNLIFNQYISNLNNLSSYVYY